ncbi:hypothetical protein [Sulfurimonas sp. NWX79]|uniref:hypothetical protein n=1 Tax=Sulfurimonas sp. NWX79 TaxID=2925412 RepID=UPI0032047052
MEWLLDYNDFLLGIIWLFNKNDPWVLFVFMLIFITYIKSASSYSWQKLLFFYVVKYLSYYLAYVADINDNLIPDATMRTFAISLMAFFYLFSYVAIKLLWLNVLIFNRDDLIYDLKFLWKFLKYSFSKIKLASKSNQNTTPLTSQKKSSKQEVQQKPKETMKVQVQKEEPKTKNLMLPKAAEIKINNNGKKVYTDKGDVYTLQKQIGFGGEGTVHIITKQLLAKIFHPDKATNEKLKKLQKFLSMRKIASVVFPEKILYDKNKKFIGYTMPQVFGVKELGILHSKKNREKYCPNWTYIDLLDLSLSIASTLQKLHDARIIVADFNPRNVLVKSPKKIYFIDIDSYQVDRQPSTVGIMMYTRPIHIKKSHKEYLKNRADDLYALSMMIFQNLTSGGNPYTTKQGGTEEDLIQRHEFAFNVKEPHKSNANSALINAWSNLSIELRQFFEDVFRYQKPVLLSTLTQALQAHRRSLMRVQTKTRSK